VENNDDLVPDPAPAPTATPSATPAPAPGGGGGGTDSGAQLLPWLLGTGSVLGVLLLAASPRLVRVGLRSRRVRPRDPVEAVPQAWNEILDLGEDYGLPRDPHETARGYAARLRQSLLGEPGGMDEAAHAAMASVTAAFERHRFGRPSAAPVDSAARDDAGHSRTAGGREGGTAPFAAGLGALEGSLRANAGAARRFRAAWLPPSVMGRLGRLAAAPFRLVGRAVARSAKAAGRAWTGKSRRGTHDGLHGQGGG
jgi:hypothetical protein